MYLAKQLEEKPLAMDRFDPVNAARIANDLLPTIAEPRRRAILENFRDHALAESLGDYKALMATCSQKSQSYATHGASPEFAAMQPQSYAELCEYYAALVEMNMYLIHFDVEKLIVGDDELVVEGICHQLMNGQMLEAIHGFDDLEPETVYQGSIRTLVIFVFDEDGLGCGEQAYSSPLQREQISPVSAAELPAQFHDGPTSVQQFLAANPGWLN